jgi:hypothetical protein
MLVIVASMLVASVTHGQSVVALRGAQIETATEAGTIEGGTILIRDGRIEAVGSDVDVPVTARVIDLSGNTVMPGIVDPYYVVSVVGLEARAEFREVVFRGRVFRIRNAPTAAPTSFTRIVDGFDPAAEDWWEAARSGITTAHLVARGVGESAVATVLPEQPDQAVGEADGQLFLALTNATKSLEVLRKGLAEPDDNKGKSRGRGSSSNQNAESPENKLWAAVRAGKQPLFVNVNNAAAILYLTQAVEEKDKANVVLVAGGDDLVRTLDALDPQRYTVVMPPRIDLIPNSQDRVNVARMLQEKNIPVAFSLSLNQSDYRSTQESPLFPVAMLVRSGLDRQLAIRALTSTPAKLMRMEKEVGSIEKGRRANLIVLDDDPFAATADIVQVLVDGKPIYEN